MSNQYCPWCGELTNNDDRISGTKLKTCGKRPCIRKQLSASWKTRRKKKKTAAKR